MAQTILIKRSTSTAVPTTLLNGELAYSSLDNGKLFIGRPGAENGDVDAIGGKYFTDIITGATDAATVSKLVLRDANGDFAANMITADLTGAVTGNVTGNVTGTVSDVSNHDTDDISEGSTNLYYTNARVDTQVDVLLKHNLHSNITVADGTGDDAGKLVLTASSQYEDSDARAAISVTDAGGDGSLSYASGTGVITYTGPSSTEVRAHISGGTGITVTDGEIATTITQYTDTAAGTVFDTKLTAADTDDLSEGSTNLYHTTARARGVLSALTSGETNLGTVGYSSSTGRISFTRPSKAQVNGEVNESLIAGTGVTKSTTALGSGVTLAIGQAVGTTDDVTFNDVTVDGTLTSNDITSSSISIDGNATITGNLTVEGITTTVNSTTVEIGDNILVLNKQLAADTAPSTNAGFTVYRGTGLGAKDSVSLLWNEVNGYWTVQEGDDASTTSKLMTADNWADSFTGTIDGGTFGS